MIVAEQWNWQDFLVWSSVTLALVYLIKRLIIQRFRRGGGGSCASCAIAQPVKQVAGVKTQKLEKREAERLRKELDNYRAGLPPTDQS